MNQIKVKVLEEDNVLCDAEISEDEIDLAIRQLTTGKSPGIDGLTNEFYKSFREMLVPVLKEVCEEILKKGELSEKMKIGMIKLIYKKRGNVNDLNNYRPLTMLNTDFKVLAKVLANRLKKGFTDNNKHDSGIWSTGERYIRHSSKYKRYNVLYEREK